MSSYGRQSRRKKDAQQFVFDDYTKCKGLTQEELDQDLKLLKLAQYSAPSTKYKITNPISKQKRQLLSSIYDHKNISCDLAKESNQLRADLQALKQQIQHIKDEIVHGQTQILISNLQKEINQRQFELVQQTKSKQIESLRKYNDQCKTSIAQIQTDLTKVTSNTTQNVTTQQQFTNALDYIKDLKHQLKSREAIISILKQNEIKNHNNHNNYTDILKLNDRITNLENKNHEQRKANTKLRTESKRLNRELEESQISYRDLLKMYKQLSNELIKTKYDANNTIHRFHEEKIEQECDMNGIENECVKYQQIATSLAAQQHDDNVLNAAISLDYYNELLVNDGLQKGNEILQTKYNELEKKYKTLNDHKSSTINTLSVYELEQIICQQKKKKHHLSQQLYNERQKYIERVVQFKDDLDALYRKTEGTAKENMKMKQDAKKKTFELQRENDKLRETLKQSHSNLRVKETETEAKHKQKEQQHEEQVKVIHGSKVDLEKRVDVLKAAIKDLNGALSDCHVQMLTFQKQVFDEMNCSKTTDEALMLQSHPIIAQIAAHKTKKPKTQAHYHRSKKRQRDDAEDKEAHHASHPPKRRKKSNHNINVNHVHNIIEDAMEDVDSSSSSEVSHASHLADDELYTFQGALENETDAEQMIFYSILTNTKTDGYILLNDYIKITRRGHPDYTGRVESMFLDKENKKKKVCVAIFQLISDIPNIRECRIINGNNDNHRSFEGGKREYVQLILSKKHQQFKTQKESTKVFGVGRIHTNKKVTLWFPKRHLQFKAIEKKTSGRDVYFCRYQYDKNNKTLTRIDGTDERPQVDYQ